MANFFLYLCSMDTTTDLREMTAGNGDYDASNIQALEGLEAVRKRPGMYIGSTDSKGLHHLVWEVIDNSIDEHLAGYCDTIETTIHADNSITVRANGRGIPTGMHEKLQKSALEVVLTVLHAGGKFDKNTYKVSGGLHGVGVSCVNALSDYLRAEVHREGKKFEQEYSKGIPQNSVTVVGDSDRTGTTITFRPDATIFEVTEYKYEVLAARMREMAFLNKGLSMKLTDERETGPDGEFKSEIFHSEGGLLEFIEFIDSAKHSLTERPVYVTATQEDVVVEVVFQYNSSYAENIYSFVNNINTREGGTHVNGFRMAVTRLLRQYGEERDLFKKLKIKPSAEDFREGLSAIVSVKVPEPQFKGQTKGEFLPLMFVAFCCGLVSKADLIEDCPDVVPGKQLFNRWQCFDQRGGFNKPFVGDISQSQKVAEGRGPSIRIGACPISKLHCSESSEAVAPL